MRENVSNFEDKVFGKYIVHDGNILWQFPLHLTVKLKDLHKTLD